MSGFVHGDSAPAAPSSARPPQPYAHNQALPTSIPPTTRDQMLETDENSGVYNGLVGWKSSPDNDRYELIGTHNGHSTSSNNRGPIAPQPLSHNNSHSNPRPRLNDSKWMLLSNNQNSSSSNNSINGNNNHNITDTNNAGLDEYFLETDSIVSAHTTDTQPQPRTMENAVMAREDESHPRLLEATRTLRQLSCEQDEVSKLLDKLPQMTPSLSSEAKDLLLAVNMEIHMRTQEQLKVANSIERTEVGRSRDIVELSQELRRLRAENAQLTKRLRHRTVLHDQSLSVTNVLDVYDWVVDISLLSELARKGWKVSFGQQFYQSEDLQLVMSDEKHAQMHSGIHPNTETTRKDSNAATSDDTTSQTVVDESKQEAWEGAVVAVVGLYDKGKTFVLNQITRANLPSGKKVSTKGLSFKHVNVDGTRLIILDSAGSYSPVKVVTELSVSEKEATELFLLDLIFDLSDYFVCVVNDFTSLDQRYLDKVTRSLQNSNKAFKEIIVVHNLKDVVSAQVLEHIWKSQVTAVYAGGRSQQTRVAARNRHGKLEEKYVHWFKTDFSRHICLVNHDSELGLSTNPWTIALLRYWLKSVFIPTNRKFSVVDSVIQYSNKKLTTYFKDPVKLVLTQGDTPYEKVIRPVSQGSVEFRLPQMTLDTSGLLLTRPDSFLPAVDVVKSDESYEIYLDVPGMSAKDITMARQNVMTIIKGTRTRSHAIDPKVMTVEQQERKFGDFTLTFTIPHRYQRKWSHCSVRNGVLCVKFKRDTEDVEQVRLSSIEQADA